MIGLGYHGTITPPVIRRNVLEDPSWYTAYTPYQPEISQGRLEALLNFQTVVGDLTGLPDGQLLAARRGHRGRRGDDAGTPGANRKATGPFVVDADALPQTIDVVRTRAEAMGIEVVVADLTDGLPGRASCAACWCSTPAPPAGSSTRGRSSRRPTRAARSPSSPPTCSRSPCSRRPASSAPTSSSARRQRFGVPLFYGGPHAGFMAVGAGLERHLPGRLVGVSVDAEGRPAYRLALQTREQHIRRDKATSNICTAQVLLAVVASMYAVYHGPEGLRAIALRAHRYAVRLADALRDGRLRRRRTSTSSTP